MTDQPTSNTEQAPYLSLASITGGVNVPSRRYRISALIPYLRKYNIDLTEYCPKISTYPPKNSLLRVPWLLAALTERLTYIQRIRGYDAVILQRELISTIPTVERFIQDPKIFDVDDAIYLHRNGRAAINAAMNSLGVVCGNNYLADRFSSWNNNIAVIPTGVDTEAVKPRLDFDKDRKRIIGWIGTSGNLRYLEYVSGAVLNVIKNFTDAELHVISDSLRHLPYKLRKHVIFKPWYPGIESIEVPSWTVGLMPLSDGEWERGKCAFKLLQYLSAGVPTVVSPVGMNIEVIGNNEVGYLAKSELEWEDAITEIITSSSKASKLSENGRKLVESYYSLDVVSSKWRTVVDAWVRGK
jgi:glycosyltransferase involved in cell wall biosynthesis